jgi:hypothetical protein
MQILIRFFCKFFYKILLLLIILAIKPLYLYAQADNFALAEPLEVQAGKEKTLYFRLTNLNFMRNNEYFTPIVQGQTFFGYQFAPTFIYLPTEKISIHAGAFFRQDFGRQDFAQVLPIFSFRYKHEHNTHTNTSITFGNLQGNLQHDLIEPLYAFERTLTNHLENGFQILHKGNRFKADAWVDWQQVAYPRGNQQEHIWAGIKTDLFLWRNAVKWGHGRTFNGDFFSFTTEPKNTLLFSAQATTFHQGGQNLNLPTPLPATNSFQLAGGLKYEAIKWHAEAYYVRTMREVYQDSITNMRIGNGLYAQAGKNWGKENKLQTILTYWQGYGVDNVLGGDLYKSFPTFPAGQIQMNRRLLMLRLSYSWKLAENTHLVARIEPYYDFVNKRVEQVQMLFITYKPTFKVATFSGID